MFPIDTSTYTQLQEYIRLHNIERLAHTMEAIGARGSFRVIRQSMSPSPRVPKTSNFAFSGSARVSIVSESTSCVYMSVCRNMHLDYWGVGTSYSTAECRELHHNTKIRDHDNGYVRQGPFSKQHVPFCFQVFFL